MSKKSSFCVSSSKQIDEYSYKNLKQKFWNENKFANLPLTAASPKSRSSIQLKTTEPTSSLSNSFFSFPCCLPRQSETTI